MLCHEGAKTWDAIRRGDGLGEVFLFVHVLF